MKRYPKSFTLCGFVFSLERIAYYGSRSMLTLFLFTAVASGGLGVDRTVATATTANLMSFTYASSIVGGWLCDRWVSPRKAIPIGLTLMALGWSCGYFAQNVVQVNAMIALITLGTGLFKGNLSALAGQLVPQEDKDGAFSWLYSLTNLGTFIGPLLLGGAYASFFATSGADGSIIYGFRPVFLLSGLSCLLGALLFLVILPQIGDVGKAPFGAMKDKTAREKRPLTPAERKHVWFILLLSFCSIFFWMFYYQAGTSLTLYMQEDVNRTILGFEIPTTWLDTSINGLLCILLPPAMAALWAMLSRRSGKPWGMTRKLAIGFFLLALSFVALAVGDLSRGGDKASVVWCLWFALFMSLGELSFSPLNNSMVSRLAPARYLSLLMGVRTLSIFAASKLSGWMEGIIENLGMTTVLVAAPILLLVFGVLLLLGEKWLGALEFASDDAA